MTMHTETPSVADNIRAALAVRERSGRWLARQLGETPAWVHRRLSGEVDVSVKDARRIAVVLDAPVTELIGIAA